MRLLPLRRPRSMALRLAAALAAMFVLTSAAGFGIAYLGARRELDEHLDEAIAEMAELLADEYRIFGAEGLRAALEALALRMGPEGLAMRLTAPGAETLFAGRPFEARGTLQGSLDAPQPGPGGRVTRVSGSVLPGGIELVVAGGLTRMRAPARDIGGVLLWTGLFTASLAVLAGFLLASGLKRRLAALTEAMQAVMEGDMTRRLLLGGGGADELDRLAQDVNAMLARIEGLMATLRQVTNDVAHDLRGPLFRLRQKLESARAATRAPEADAAVLETALAELDAVLATFTALLRIAQVEAGARRAAFAPVDLSTLAAGIAEVYAAVAEEVGATLETPIAPHLWITGDAGLLRQAMANLIENALAHGGSGVRFALAVVPGPMVEVSDDGPGIPSAERTRVLDRFYRLDRSRQTAGTGLGLALAAAVVWLHGGAVSLHDATEGAARPGLRIRLDLRAAACPAPDAAAA